MVATPSDVIRVLEVDPDLGEGLDERERPLAEQHLVAAELRLPRGAWNPDHPLGQDPGDLGFLIVDGIIVRETELGRHAANELLGPGDLLRPWESEGGAGAPMPSGASWRLLERTRLAILDARFTALAGRFPPVVSNLVGRALQRARFQALLLAAAAMPRLDARLLAVLWHIAERWGRVTSEGTQVGVRLTHEMLAGLVGAQRPSVSTALKALERAGVVGRDADGNLLLLGAPPDDAEQAVEELAASSR
jgi:CRP-like cAMP-binding protein